MKIKTQDLSDNALDWAAAASCGYSGWDGECFTRYADGYPGAFFLRDFRVSTDWSQGGPIIEREGIELLCNLTATEAARFQTTRADWQAFYRTNRTTEGRRHGTTPLIAAMRCFVASRLGDEVDVPDELAEEEE
jgi:hypothetical protein